MLNFTVGPVQMDKKTRNIAEKQIPYFRTPEFSKIMKENERLLCEFFDAPEESRVIFMTGSGTASMEATVMNCFTSKDRVLVVNGGSFGQRLVQLCQIHDIPFTEIKLSPGQPLTREHLECFTNNVTEITCKEQIQYTGMLLQLCETSTGVLYDMNMVGDFCRRNNIFLMVDAVSGFLADPISMRKQGINVAITGSQKALSLPPSMSYIIMDQATQERVNSNQVKSMYFNLVDYLKNGERGQTPFTPAVQTCLMLNEKLTRIAKEGGVSAQNKKIAEKAAFFRSAIKDLPLKLFTEPESTSNCVTVLSPTSGKSSYEIFTQIKDNYGMWICPNGGELKDKIFRVGHIGNISKKDLIRLVRVLRKVCQ